MPNIPTNLSLNNIQQIFDGQEYINQIEIEFDIILDTWTAAFELYRSRDDITYELVDTFLLTSSTGIDVIHSYMFNSSSWNGTNAYFKLKTLDKDNLSSSLSSALLIQTIHDPVSSAEGYFDIVNSNHNLQWDEITQDSIKNTLSFEYQIVRKKLDPLTSFIYETNTIEYGTVVVKDLSGYLKVHDKLTNSHWFGNIENNQLQISIENLCSGGDITIDYSQLDMTRLSVFHADAGYSDVIITGLTSNSTTYGTYELDTNYLYGVFVKNLITSDNSFITFFHLLTSDITKDTPILRSIWNSDTEALINIHWRNIASTLIDEYYYKKDFQTIPYFEKEINFKGYIDVPFALVDLWLNDKFLSTVVSDKEGAFEVGIQLIKGKNNIRLRGRDSLSIASSNTGFINYTTQNIYTWFAILGIELEDTEVELQQIEDNISIDTANKDGVDSNFASKITVRRAGGQDLDEYKDQYKHIRDAFYKGETLAAIEEISEAFIKVDHIDVFERDSYLDFYQVNESVITKNGFIGYSDYMYGVSAVKLSTRDLNPLDYGTYGIGGYGLHFYGTKTYLETPVTQLRLDRRHYKSSTGINIIKWDKVEDAELYRIYRKNTTNGPFGLVATTDEPIFVDYEDIPPDLLAKTRTLNYSGIDDIVNILRGLRAIVREDEFFTYKKHVVTIVVFPNSGEQFDNNEKTNISLILKKVIPGHIKSNILFGE